MMRTGEQPERKGLVADTRGAIMLMGLFMACGLIASMWYVVGVGDAIVYHQRMQEAADHAVFSDAVVHARGMNLIAAINLVMYIITAIWLVLCLIDSILEAAEIALGIICLVSCLVGCEACTLEAEAIDLQQTVDKFKDAYKETAVDIGLPACATIQTVAAIGYPWYGEYASYSIGNDYGRTVMSFSPSMIPGNALTGGLSSYFKFSKPPPTTSLSSAFTGADSKLGLPVVNRKMSDLCKWVGFDVVDMFIPSFIARFTKWAGGLLGSVLSTAYCSGTPWDSSNGPKSMFGQAKNGNDFMQVWSYAFTNGWSDTSEKRVTLGEGPKIGLAGVDTSSPPIGYYAEAEFYFDCDGKWNDQQCNANEPNGESEALFHMDWRGRLRRARMPNILGDIMAEAGQFLLQGVSNWVFGNLGESSFGKWAKNLSPTLFDFAQGQGKQMLSNEGKKIISKVSGSTASAISQTTQTIH